MIITIQKCVFAIVIYLAVVFELIALLLWKCIYLLFYTNLNNMLKYLLYPSCVKLSPGESLDSLKSEFLTLDFVKEPPNQKIVE